MSPIPPGIPRKTSLAVGLWTGLAVLAVLLWSRRLSGQFVGPLPAIWLVMWTTAVFSASAAAAWLYRASQTVADERTLRRVSAVSWTVALVTSWAGAPGLTPLQTGVFLGLWGTVSLLAWSLTHGPDVWRAVLAAPREPAALTTMLSVPDATVRAEPISAFQDGELQDDALQTMSRRIVDDGEVIEGQIRVTLPAGEREGTVHVSFCPPLPASPDVELEDVDGLGWTLKVAVAFPFGVRIQVRRGAAWAEAETGRIAYWACAATSSRAA
uniref:Uncharacterized protein n=1 Tax=Schlesneria paludicola TaxID=360056 RepID=A0A7C2K1Z1_9PLAN